MSSIENSLMLFLFVLVLSWTAVKPQDVETECAALALPHMFIDGVCYVRQTADMWWTKWLGAPPGIQDCSTWDLGGVLGTGQFITSTNLTLIDLLACNLPYSATDSLTLLAVKRVGSHKWDDGLQGWYTTWGATMVGSPTVKINALLNKWDEFNINNTIWQPTFSNYQWFTSTSTHHNCGQGGIHQLGDWGSRAICEFRAHPCKPEPCAVGQFCVPNAAFTTYQCITPTCPTVPALSYPTTQFLRHSYIDPATGVQTMNYGCAFNTNAAYDGRPEYVSQSVECTGPGTWEPQVMCVAVCPAISDANNQTVTYSLTFAGNRSSHGGLYYMNGTVATLSCDPDTLTPTGIASDQRTCAQTIGGGMFQPGWDVTALDCKPVCYRHELMFDAGTNETSATYSNEVIVNTTIAGGNVTYDCDSDKATTDGEVTQAQKCNTSRAWTGGKTCHRACPALTTANNIIGVTYSKPVINAPSKPLVHNEYPADTLATFDCLPDHFPNSVGVTCSGVNGTWLGIEATMCYADNPKSFRLVATDVKGTAGIVYETLLTNEDQDCGTLCGGWECRGFSYKPTTKECLLHNDDYDDNGVNTVAANGYYFWQKFFVAPGGLNVI